MNPPFDHIEKKRIRKKNKKWRQKSPKFNYDSDEDLLLLNLKLNNMVLCKCESIHTIFLQKCPDCGEINSQYIPPE